MWHASAYMVLPCLSMSSSPFLCPQQSDDVWCWRDDLDLGCNILGERELLELELPKDELEEEEEELVLGDQRWRLQWCREVIGLLCGCVTMRPCSMRGGGGAGGHLPTSYDRVAPVQQTAKWWWVGLVLGHAAHAPVHNSNLIEYCYTQNGNCLWSN